MTYTVVLDDTVKAELAAVWLAAGVSGRQAARRALEAINERLSKTPYEQSESRGADERIAFVLPVGVRYAVSDAISRVAVRSIWYVRPHDGTRTTAF